MSFVLPGGFSMHLNDSLNYSKLIPVYCPHEVGAAFAACGYAQYTGGLGVCLVTSGPGSTNALTAVASAWQDSIPLLVISGGVSRRGGYVLWQSDPSPEVILIGTGSELHIALAAGQALAGEGTRVSVVSLPSWEMFDRQPADYRESVLPSVVRARVAVEAARLAGLGALRWPGWGGNGNGSLRRLGPLCHDL